MIEYKPYVRKNLTGVYYGEVREVELEPNQYYKEDDPNSTKDVMSITFALLAGEGELAEIEKLTVRFVAPLLGVGLFQQLVDAKGVDVKEKGGQLDEQQFVDMPVLVSVGKNKKGYPTVEHLQASDKKIDWMTRTFIEGVEVPDFLK